MYMSINAIWVHMAEKQLEKGNYYAVRFYNYVPSFFLSLILNGVPAFLAVMFGPEVTPGLTQMPPWLMDIFNIAGGILPALGVAMLLNFLGKGKLLGFFFLGFFITVYIKLPVLADDGTLTGLQNFPTMGVAVLGTILAVLMYQFDKRNNDAPGILESFKGMKAETKEAEKKEPYLRKRDLVKTWILGYSSECAYNYERLQAMGNANAFIPVINRLYPKEKRSSELKKYMNFFNTEPSFIGPIIQGVTSAMEETRAKGEDIKADDIVSLRSSLMGPIAGMGDTVSQSIIYPILAGICIQFALAGNIAGPIIFEVAYKTLLIVIGYNMFMLGYKQGKVAILNFLRTGVLDRIMESVSIVGLMVIGNMAVNNVKFSVPAVFEFDNSLGGVSLNLQTQVFDALLPGMLPLAIVLVFFFMIKKRVKPTTVILLSFGIAIAYVIVVTLTGGYGTFEEIVQNCSNAFTTIGN